MITVETVLDFIEGWLRSAHRGMDVDDFMADLRGTLIPAARAEGAREALLAAADAVKGLPHIFPETFDHILRDRADRLTTEAVSDE